MGNEGRSVRCIWVDGPADQTLPSGVRFLLYKGIHCQSLSVMGVEERERDEREILSVMLVNWNKEYEDILRRYHQDVVFHTYQLAGWPCVKRELSETLKGVALGTDMLAIRSGSMCLDESRRFRVWVMKLGLSGILVMELPPADILSERAERVVGLMEIGGALLLAGGFIEGVRWDCLAAAEFFSPLGTIAAGVPYSYGLSQGQSVDRLIDWGGNDVFVRINDFDAPPGIWGNSNDLLAASICEPHEGIPRSYLAGWRSLKHVSFEGTEVKRIGPRAFEGCGALRTIRLPPSLEWAGKQAFAWSGLVIWDASGAEPQLESNCFEGCVSLREVLMKGGVLGTGLFQGCRSLKYLDVGRARGVSYGVLDGSFITRVECGQASKGVQRSLKFCMDRLECERGIHESSEKTLQMKAQGFYEAPPTVAAYVWPGREWRGDQWGSVISADLSQIDKLDGLTMEGCAMLREATLSPRLETLPSGFFGNCYQLGRVDLGGCKELQRVFRGAFFGCVRLADLGVLPSTLFDLCLGCAAIEALDLRLRPGMAVDVTECISLRSLIMPRVSESLECGYCVSLRRVTIGVMTGSWCRKVHPLDMEGVPPPEQVRIISAQSPAGAKLARGGRGCEVLSEVAGLARVCSRPALPL